MKLFLLTSLTLLKHFRSSNCLLYKTKESSNFANDSNADLKRKSILIKKIYYAKKLYLLENEAHKCLYKIFASTSFHCILHFTFSLYFLLIERLLCAKTKIFMLKQWRFRNNFDYFSAQIYKKLLPFVALLIFDVIFWDVQ